MLSSISPRIIAAPNIGRGAHEVAPKVIQNGTIEMCSRFRAIDAVRLARIQLQVVGQICIDQFLNELDGVLQVHIVISRALHQQ